MTIITVNIPGDSVPSNTLALGHEWRRNDLLLAMMNFKVSKARDRTYTGSIDNGVGVVMSGTPVSVSPV